MTRALLTLFVLVACKDPEPRRTGPAYTALVATQLKSLAADCELRNSDGGGQVATCTGLQAKMTIELDGQRRLIGIGTTLTTGTQFEAQTLVEQTFRGVLPPPVITGIVERLGAQEAARATIEGIELSVHATRGQGAASYSINVRW